MNTRVNLIFTLITIFILAACAPVQVPATPTSPPTLTALPTATHTSKATPTHVPTSTPTPTPTTTRTPTPTQPPAATASPTVAMLAEFEFGGVTFQVTKAFLAPTCAQAEVKAGQENDVTANNPKGTNCVVLMINLPEVTDFQKAIEMMITLQGSVLVDQDGGKLKQEPYMGITMAQGSNPLQMRIYFVVKPTGKTFAWILPDGQEIAIAPSE